MAYTPTEWETGDVITAEKLNNIEDGIVANEEAAADAEQVVLTVTLTGAFPEETTIYNPANISFDWDYETVPRNSVVLVNFSGDANISVPCYCNNKFMDKWVGVYNINAHQVILVYFKASSPYSATVQYLYTCPDVKYADVGDMIRLNDNGYDTIPTGDYSGTMVVSNDMTSATFTLSDPDSYVTHGVANDFSIVYVSVMILIGSMPVGIARLPLCAPDTYAGILPNPSGGFLALMVSLQNDTWVADIKSL